MPSVLLAIPFAAVLAILLLSVGVRPRYVLVVWATIAVLATATTFLLGASSPPSDVSATAPVTLEKGA